MMLLDPCLLEFELNIYNVDWVQDTLELEFAQSSLEFELTMYNVDWIEGTLELEVNHCYPHQTPRRTNQCHPHRRPRGVLNPKP